MKSTIIACLIAVTMSSSAFAAKKPEAPPAAPEVTLTDLLKPMKEVLAAPIRIAEDFDPDKLCVCKKWEITEVPCCLEPGPNGTCTRRGMCEVSRECKDWACHRKS